MPRIQIFQIPHELLTALQVVIQKYIFIYLTKNRDLATVELKVKVFFSHLPISQLFTYKPID